MFEFVINVFRNFQIGVISPLSVVDLIFVSFFGYLTVYIRVHTSCGKSWKIGGKKPTMRLGLSEKMTVL